LNKKLLIALVIVVIAVVAVVIGIFVLPGLFAPPVDISGVNPPVTMTTAELLPTELAGNQLVGTAQTGDVQVTSDIRSFIVERTLALYDGITINIIKADDESDASDTLDVIYEDVYGSGSGTRTQTTNWFKVDIDGTSAFFWRSGVWVFGVEAGDGDTRKQAAEALVQHLESLSP
jgi:hypothetical protein